MSILSQMGGWKRWATALAVVLVVNVLMGAQLFGGSIDGMLATPSYPTILLINTLVGISIFLFALELRRDAIRVVITVVLALIFGYLLTSGFNLDSANRFKQGDFKVTLESENERIDNDDVDIQYGRSRSDTFNDPKAATPLADASYTFEGKAGDVVTVLAYAANRRSDVNMQVELLDPSGASLAQATNATTEQVDTYDDLVSESDAVIENFALPADGIYTIHAQPEPVSFGTVLSETLTETNLAYKAFLQGPLQRVNRWSFWIQDAITLIMLGLALSVVFTAQQFSLGAEGQIIFGALASGVVALTFTNLPPIIVVPLALIASMIGGFLWGMLPGVLKAYLGANELVASLMLNAIAFRFFELVLTFQLKPADAGGLNSEWFLPDFRLAPIIESTSVTTGLYILLAVIVIVWLLMRRTPLGYEIRIIGANLKFADYGGINTRRTIMLSMALSGVIAGLAGAHLTMGIQGRLVSGISAGLAFEGVVVALLARNNPLVVPFTGLLYAYLRVGAQFMESDANVSFEVVRVIQAAIILLITAEALLSFYKRQQVRRRGTIELAVQPEQLTQPMAAEEK